MNDAQDAFAQLVEDCRTGLLNRIVVTPYKSLFIPHKSGLDLSDLPVFYMGDLSSASHVNHMSETSNNKFRLPYDRCAFMYFVPGDHPKISAFAQGKSIS